MTESSEVVYGGVDTHKDTHTAAVMDARGRIRASHTFAATPVGYRQLTRWLSGHGHVAAVGVEGTGSYGAGLTRYLNSEHLTVVEVMRPDRQRRRRLGKNDTVDAEAAARAALHRDGTATPKRRDGIVESIRMLRVVFTATRNTRTRVINQFHALATTAPAPVQAALHSHASIQQVRIAAAWRPGADLADPATAAKTALRMLARQYLDHDTELARLRRQLDHLTHQANPALRQMFGVGPDVAATLLITVGDNPDRLHSEAAFAALCGVSPVEVSSGRHARHRLNRSGDRQANHALWRLRPGPTQSRPPHQGLPRPPQGPGQDRPRRSAQPETLSRPRALPRSRRPAPTP